MGNSGLSWILVLLIIGSFIGIDAHNHHHHHRNKAKHRERRFFFDSTCPDLCLQKVDPGTCTLFLHKYYYNALTLTCTKFLYSGCGANTNSFDTLIECQTTCGGCGTAPPAVPAPVAGTLGRK